MLQAEGRGGGLGQDGGDIETRIGVVEELGVAGGSWEAMLLAMLLAVLLQLSKLLGWRSHKEKLLEVHTTNRLALPSPRYLAVPCLGLPRGLDRARQPQMACLGLPRVLGEISEGIPSTGFFELSEIFCHKYF